MRRSLIVVLTALLLIVPTVALAGSAPSAPNQVAPENHVAADVPSNENFGRAIYNHFGDPAAGQAVIETWTRVTYSDAALPITNQGFGSAIRLKNVERIALRVILHTRGGTVSSGFSSPVCNNGNQAANPLIFNCASPVVESGGLVPNPNFCETYTTVLYAIRWTDGSLSDGKILRSPADLVNDTCRVN